MEINNINILVLAYLGDSAYELYVREMLINKNISSVDELQKTSTKYVSAKGQYEILNRLINNNYLTNDEIDIIKRGRNYKRDYHPKNTDIITYKYSTGFEALLGYLYLTNKNRLKEVLEKAVE